MKYIAFLFGLMLLLSACSKEMSDKQIAAVEAEIRAQVALVLEATENLDLEALKGHISDDDRTTLFLNGTSLNASAWLDEMEAIFSELESQKIEIISDEVIVFSPRYAMWKAVAKSAIKAVDAQGISEELLAESWIWQKQGRDWKLIHYHESF